MACFARFYSFHSLRYCRNQLQYQFVSTRPNDKVMTAALTRSYEKTVQFRVGHRTAAMSMKQTSVAAADYSGRTLSGSFNVIEAGTNRLPVAISY